MEGIAPVLELATHGQVFVVLIVGLSRRGVVAEENAWEQTCLRVDDSFLFFLGGGQRSLALHREWRSGNFSS